MILLRSNGSFDEPVGYTTEVTDQLIRPGSFGGPASIRCPLAPSVRVGTRTGPQPHLAGDCQWRG